MIAILFAGFIVYLYTPHLLFKAAAAAHYDFLDRKGLPQVEEFFSAGLPSFFLNLKTLVVLNVITLVFNRSWFTIDRVALSNVFVKDPDLSDFVAYANLRPLLSYLAVLAFVSWQTGLSYSKILARVAKAGGPELYFEQPSGWHFVPATIRVLRFNFWRKFYQSYEQPLYPVILRNDFAFVRTDYGLFYGLMYAADKNANGDIEGITLVGATKINYRDEEMLIKRGRNPMTELSGPIFLRWNEVTDINYPTEPDIIERMRSAYEGRIEQAMRRRTLAGRLQAAIRTLI